MPLPIFHDGTEDRILAAMPPKPVFGLPDFGVSYPLVPHDQYHDTDWTWMKVPILNQKQTQQTDRQQR